MSAPEIVVVAAVAVGMSVQSALGFGFAFFVAPAAFAAFEPVQAVTLVLVLAVAINLLVLFGERRRARVARRAVATIAIAAIPGLALGAWIVTELDRDWLQLLVGAVVLGGAALQSREGRVDDRAASTTGRIDPVELGGGFAAGVLTTSVSVNGPALVLVMSRLGLRGDRLRDSLAAALLALSLPAIVIVIAAAGDTDLLPGAIVIAACFPAVLVGHRLGLVVFRRLDDAAHRRAALMAAGLAGLLSLVAGAVRLL